MPDTVASFRIINQMIVAGNVSRQLNRMSKQMRGFDRIVTKVKQGLLGFTVGTAAFLAIKRSAGSVLELADNLVTARRTINQFTGDAEKTAKIMSFIRKETIETPFEAPEFIKAGTFLAKTFRGSKDMVSDIKLAARLSELLGATLSKEAGGGIEKAVLAIQDALDSNQFRRLQNFGIQVGKDTLAGATTASEKLQKVVQKIAVAYGETTESLMKNIPQLVLEQIKGVKGQLTVMRAQFQFFTADLFGPLQVALEGVLRIMNQRFTRNLDRIQKKLQPFIERFASVTLKIAENFDAILETLGNISKVIVGIGAVKFAGALAPSIVPTRGAIAGFNKRAPLPVVSPFRRELGGRFRTARRSLGAVGQAAGHLSPFARTGPPLSRRSLFGNLLTQLKPIKDFFVTLGKPLVSLLRLGAKLGGLAVVFSTILGIVNVLGRDFDGMRTSMNDAFRDLFGSMDEFTSSPVLKNIGRMFTALGRLGGFVIVNAVTGLLKFLQAIKDFVFGTEVETTRFSTLSEAFSTDIRDNLSGNIGIMAAFFDTFGERMKLGFLNMGATIALGIAKILELVVRGIARIPTAVVEIISLGLSFLFERIRKLPLTPKIKEFMGTLENAFSMSADQQAGFGKNVDEFLKGPLDKFSDEIIAENTKFWKTQTEKARSGKAGAELLFRDTPDVNKKLKDKFQKQRDKNKQDLQQTPTVNMNFGDVKIVVEPQPGAPPDRIVTTMLTDLFEASRFRTATSVINAAAAAQVKAI